MPCYRHTQSSPLFWLSAPIWITEALLPLLTPLPRPTIVVFWFSAIVVMILSWLFSKMTVEDQTDTLAVWFGPVWIIGTRIPYSEITSFASEKTTWLDVWGLHYVRCSWLWNVWGFDCVRMTTSSHTIRIGTDDVEGLLNLLAERTSAAGTSPPSN